VKPSVHRPKEEAYVCSAWACGRVNQASSRPNSPYASQMLGRCKFESKHLQPEQGASMLLIKVYKLLGQSSSRAICFGPILVPLGLVQYNLAVPSPPGSASNSVEHIPESTYPEKMELGGKKHYTARRIETRDGASAHSISLARSREKRVCAGPNRPAPPRSSPHLTTHRARITPRRTRTSDRNGEEASPSYMPCLFLYKRTQPYYLKFVLLDSDNPRCLP
jgi:hypothetical protein